MPSDKCPTCHRPFKRSNSQNAYLWGVIYKHIGEYTGHSSEEVHEFCKARFLPRSFVVIGGVEMPSIKSTTQLTVPEFSEYVDRVTAFAGELGIELPVRSET